MMQRVEIVPACAAWVPRLADISRRSFSDPWSEAVFHQTLKSESSHIWCAAKDHEILGYLVFSHAGAEMSVDDIAVLTEYRRQGIAGQLLSAVHDRYATCSFWLEARESNAPAILLYTSLGYVQVGFRKRYYTNPEEGAVLMTCFARKDREIKTITLESEITC